jgi:hypothetical protein
MKALQLSAHGLRLLGIKVLAPFTALPFRICDGALEGLLTSGVSLELYGAGYLLVFVAWGRPVEERNAS